MKTSEILRAAAAEMRRTDTRGTRKPSAEKTVLFVESGLADGPKWRRANKAEAQRAAIQSANEAGYRKGRDERERELNTIHDNEINVLRNQVATIQMDTVAIMDREFVKGWLASNAFFNEICPEDEIAVMSVRLANAIARELTRAYDKEKQA